MADIDVSPKPLRAAVAHDDQMPAGPYTIGLTSTPHGLSQPYIIRCGDGRAIAGHVESLDVATKIVRALNAAYPTLRLVHG